MNDVEWKEWEEEARNAPEVIINTADILALLREHDKYREALERISRETYGDARIIACEALGENQ